MPNLLWEFFQTSNNIIDIKKLPDFFRSLPSSQLHFETVDVTNTLHVIIVTFTLGRQLVPISRVVSNALLKACDWGWRVQLTSMWPQLRYATHLVASTRRSDVNSEEVCWTAKWGTGSELANNIFPISDDRWKGCQALQTTSGKSVHVVIHAAPKTPTINRLIPRLNNSMSWSHTVAKARAWHVSI